jgi:hypothetical protein
MVRQRLFESKGGECASVFGMQCALTATVLQYAALRKQGFSAMPFQARKFGKYSALFFTGVAGSMFGHLFARSAFGDAQQLAYIASNKSEILSGEKSLN